MFDRKKTKAVLWDLDDTIFSRVEAARKTFYGMFRMHLYPNQNEKFIEEAVAYMMTQVKRNSMIDESSFQALLAKFPSDIPYCRENCVDYYYEHIGAFAEPFPEVIEVIKKLKEQGIKIGLVTNVAEDRVDSQWKKISTMKLETLFDVMVLSGELGIHKPDRKIFDKATEKLGVSNRECVYVGDDPHSDVEGGLNADMEVVWIDRWPYDGRYDSNASVHRVGSVLEYFSL